MNNKKYKKLAEQVASKSNVLKDCFCAFLVGGAICVLGQAFSDFYWQVLEVSLSTARALTSISLITLSIILTGLNIYPKIAKFAGAGTLVPITGFANAVVSPAIEFKSEGWVLGLGANMFKIAGPVIVYGTVASVVYGIIYWITTLF